MNRLTLTLIAVCSAVSGAQAQTRPLTLQDYYRVEAVNGTAISPDGRTVVYVRSVILEPENRRNSEIWAVARRRQRATAPVDRSGVEFERAAVEPGRYAAHLHRPAPGREAW